MSTLSQSTQIHLYRTSELDEYRESYDKLKARAFCPVHGSDKQRSLCIDLQPGDNRGFAYCQQCNARVLLEDVNPDAAQRIRDKDANEQGGMIARRPIRIRVPSAAPKKEPPKESYDLAPLKKYSAHMQRCLNYDRPRAYLQQRVVSYDQAVEQRVMYLPAIDPSKQTPELKRLERWYDHIIFPLSSTRGQGFIGRNLQYWEPGMDEAEHRDILKSRNVPPYLKTNPAGYFRFDETVAKYADIVIVEGAFDAFACLTIMENVISLGGVAFEVKMLPLTVKHVWVALDGDDTGRAKAVVLKRELIAFGIDADILTIQDDTLGKDWNERYRRAGIDGLAALLPLAAKQECLSEFSLEDQVLFMALSQEEQIAFIEAMQESAS